MINGALIHRILQNPSALAGASMEIRPGQILKGKVLELLPGSQAIVQLEKIKVVSRLEASLRPGDKAWFQVQPNQGKVVLKLLADEGKCSQKDDPLLSLASSLGLGDNPEYKMLLERIVNEQIPLSKEHIYQLKELLRELGIDQNIVEATLVALKREIPLARDVIQGLSAFLFGSDIIDLMNELKNEVRHWKAEPSNEQTENLLEKLQMKLDSLLQFRSDPIRSGPDLARWFHEIGVHWENQIGREQPLENDSLKSILLQLKDALPLESSAKLLSFVTGQQLFLAPSESVFQQLILHIPFLPFEHAFAQVEGKKKPNGELDPDNCRLLFYLQFPHLGNLLLDVRIIERMVGVEFHGEEKRLTAHLLDFKQELQRSLQAQGYRLSSVKITLPKDKEPGARMLPKGLAMPYKGVDFRI